MSSVLQIKKYAGALPGIRPLVLQVLKRLDRDVRITNPWSKDRLIIHAYHHKGYWFYGRQREGATMRAFSTFCRPGDVVLEVGGHVGFITQYLARLTGPSGTVVVFEPGENNLPYLHRNMEMLPWVRIEELACSDRNGEARFYEDGITGQNNSLLANYAGLDGVAGTHGGAAERRERVVPTVRLDHYCEERSLRPDFIKIDVEGAELAVLRGAGDLLRTTRCVMVEVTENHAQVESLLIAAGLELRDLAGIPCDAIAGSANYFGIGRGQS